MKLIFNEWLERNGYSSVEEAVGALYYFFASPDRGGAERYFLADLRREAQ